MIVTGDLFDVLPTLDAASVDACVTDPPYGIGFMGKEWDTFKPGVVAQPERYEAPIESANPNLKGRRRSPAISASQIPYDRSLHGQLEFQAWTERWAREVYRVLKPGAHLVVCGAPRSFHRMTCGLEDAGFEIRDCLSWLYGQGFPKSLNLGEGRGTALKPSWEPCVLARKPFKGSVTANVEAHGTGGLGIDACRIPFLGPDDAAAAAAAAAAAQRTSHIGLNGTTTFQRTGDVAASIAGYINRMDNGRWPANVVLDEEAAALLDEQTGESRSAPQGQGGQWTAPARGFIHSAQRGLSANYNDIGGASRFYYVAKPSREERDFGCVGLTERPRDESRKEGNQGGDNPRNRGLQPRGNFHPTVKPVELMRWLVKLVTPIGGTVLDPFTGSGTTGMACRYEHREFVGIEREPEYVAIAECRIAAVAPLFADEVVR